jgi:geranylgeranylglycerol-phosphate geranylgeranyltransferase
LDLALVAGFFLIAGEILAIGGLPPANQVLLGFLTLFFISGSANISNDYFDRDVDRINLPGRLSLQVVFLFVNFGSCFSFSVRPC